MNSELARIFGPDGQLAQTLPNFRPRTQQIELAEAIAEAIANNTQLVAEAGTGTGKTFAYLVPALLSGGKVIIATGTKTLQDQLFDRDLPRVRDALKLPVETALLKGRSNYVCHHHLMRTRSEGRFTAREQIQHVQRISAFAERSKTGDKADCETVPESSPVWPLVTSTRENCLGSECGFFKDCFVLKARKEALLADIVVVNHHLLFADMALKDDGLGELLPACNTVIIDEAHRAPDVATNFFGESTSMLQAIELARDCELDTRSKANELVDLIDAAMAAGMAARAVRLGFDTPAAKVQRDDVLTKRAFTDALDKLIEQLSDLADLLETHQDRSEEFEGLRARTNEIARRLSDWRDDKRADLIRWVDVSNTGWQLHATPLSVADVFKKETSGSAKSWIFTSATLSAGGKFDLFTRQLGLETARAQSWSSPFDYSTAGRVYVPKNIPPPNSPEHTSAVIAEALELVTVSRGRAFLLFTSLRAMRQCAEALPNLLRERDLDYPIFTQNEAPKGELLRRFREAGNAILIGSQSFWEGVDVAGDALSLVVIDKLPFAPPDDPVLVARMKHLEEGGGSPFMDWQVPQAAISLKQGAGRLIRSETDRGVLAICDDRIVTKGYGRVLRSSLPPMPFTRERADVAAFFTSS
ncbi:MAG: ATP-dependent DNA helicase [Burkholderiales bacterium]|nr:MAG: ATP-dependent DNA helicase [Betaproteobacteria bacterium]TAG24468.1 MAG: ATP-dependent DNA helicase [Burkholderiales bacterium]